MSAKNIHRQRGQQQFQGVKVPKCRIDQLLPKSRPVFLKVTFQKYVGQVHSLDFHILRINESAGCSVCEPSKINKNY